LFLLHFFVNELFLLKRQTLVQSKPINMGLRQRSLALLLK
jgi:hypothetical protein